MFPPFLIQLYSFILTLQLDQFLGSRSAVYIAFAGMIIYNDAFSLELKGVAIGATIVFVLGLIDDFKRVPAKLKLFVQMIAVAIMIHYDVVAHFLPDVWWGKLFEVLITFM